jgi:hypothetical protein
MAAQLLASRAVLSSTELVSYMAVLGDPFLYSQLNSKNGFREPLLLSTFREYAG